MLLCKNFIYYREKSIHPLVPKLQLPALKSCWSQGKIKAEVLQNIREAIKLYLEPDPIELSTCTYQEIVKLFV
jgi:hypothetical protein